MIRPGPLSAADASFLNEKMRELEYLLRREESRLGQQAEIFPAAITSSTTLSWTTNTTFTTVLTGTTVTTLTTVTSLTAIQHGWYEEAFTDIGTRVTMIGGRSGSNVVDVARMPDGSAVPDVTPTSPVHVWMRRTGLGVTSGVNHEVVSMAGQSGAVVRSSVYTTFSALTTIASNSGAGSTIVATTIDAGRYLMIVAVKAVAPASLSGSATASVLGIRVNSVSPEPVPDPIWETWIRDSPSFYNSDTTTLTCYFDWPNGGNDIQFEFVYGLSQDTIVSWDGALISIP